MSIVENLIVELSDIVELSIVEETMLEHCFTLEFFIVELSEINELSEIVDELSTVELSTE